MQRFAGYLRSKIDSATIVGKRGRTDLTSDGSPGKATDEGTHHAVGDGDAAYTTCDVYSRPRNYTDETKD